MEDAEPSSAESGKGLGLAYLFLNKRERTVAEVRSRLERAGIPAEEIDEVITELLEFGYLDDARYARVFTQDKRTLEAWGSERIARALQERGVERELIEAALVRDQAEAGWDVGAGHGERRTVAMTCMVALARDPTASSGWSARWRCSTSDSPLGRRSGAIANGPSACSHARDMRARPLPTRCGNGHAARLSDPGVGRLCDRARNARGAR